MHQPWVVLKFGGTSVSSRRQLAQHLAVLKERIAGGQRPVVVHSALSGVTDRLEALLGAALRAAGTRRRLEAAREVHRELARDLGIVPDERFETFSSAAAAGRCAPAASRHISDHRARVMARGELLATSLGAAI